MTIIYFLVFIFSFLILYFSSRWLVGTLIQLAKFLGWKEFVVAFFTMALAGSLPNFLVGISSALHQIPHLSLSEIIGGNVIDLTLAVALAVFFSKNGLSLGSKTVQDSAVFTLLIAVLSLFLIADGDLSRTDGLILILTFVFYVIWLFNKKERFTKAYNHLDFKIGLGGAFRMIGRLLLALFLVLLAAEGIVRSAVYFSSVLNLPLFLIGILVVGLGNALPEIFFAIQAARKENDWLVVGDLMGALIFPATLVLGIVALICPIEIGRISPFLIGRFALVIAAFFFLIFLRTGRRISKKEGLFLLGIYLVFVILEALIGSA